ncbi:Crp/Fnr family transcriptional regulator [Lunatibacter salilacus]|uniref:Crp/Fnr family transcriptional regulator n=1 Tax=Lunatibacter salilacus TaxID=2483804 RepID=UPI00131D1F15|nr:Crp/Fnr family transcriptional regulator [Lunatibacter salilacus]
MQTLNQFYTHPLIGAADLEKIRAKHHRVKFKKGDVILEKGRQANAYYCMEKGLARAYVVSHSGQEITTGFILSGEIAIDVVSIFTRIPAAETIVCLSECLCYQINFEDFQELFHSIPGLSEWGRNWMSKALFAHRKRSISMITESALDRYLDLVKNYPEIIEKAPLKHIATYLGVTDSSLSRIRKEIARQ